MHRLGSDGAIEEPPEGALACCIGGCRGALVSSLREAHLVLEVLAEGLAEAEAEAGGGHVGGCGLELAFRRGGVLL